jgi:AraC family transcriptional regulator of adaptative response/methylated-DNA-[protein]-cysteine methyltransferase
MGMTPAVYRCGSNGIRIRYAISDSALGRILVAGTEQESCAVLLGEDEDLQVRELREEFPKAILKHETSVEWSAAVHSCQSEDPLFSKLPMSLRGRILQAKVWNALQ